MIAITIINPYHYNIPRMGDPMLHRNLEWFATEDNKVLGVVIQDRIDNDFSWVVLTDTPEDTPGYCAVNMEASLPTRAEATRVLHEEMKKEWGK